MRFLKVFAESRATQLRVKAVLSISPISLQCQVRTKYVSPFSGGSGQGLGHEVDWTSHDVFLYGWN